MQKFYRRKSAIKPTMKIKQRDGMIKEQRALRGGFLGWERGEPKKEKGWLSLFTVKNGYLICGIVFPPQNKSWKY